MADGPVPELELDTGVLRAVERLRHISGFASTLELPGDPRASVFRRLDHIQRVDGVTRRLAPNAELHDALLLVWIHDLNRWPFAHNSERGRHDQAETSEEYLAPFSSVSAAAANDTSLIHRKAFEELSPAGRVVLAADMIGGGVEDVLLFCAGLAYDPVLLPARFAEITGVDLAADPWRERLRVAAVSLHRDRSPDHFRRLFMPLFQDVVQRAIDEQRRKGDAPVDLQRRLVGAAGAIREEVVAPTVFPINNERVSRGSRIRDLLVEPLAEHLGLERFEQLMDTADEVTLFEHPAVDGSVREQLVPDLDYVTRELPGSSLL